MLLKTDSIVIRADRMLSNAQKAESDYWRKKNKNKASKKKKTLKILSANFMSIIINNLIKKIKALILQILTISEAVINQTRIFLL